MGQSLSQMYIHLTFGTKNRYPFIKPEWESKLHAYIAGIMKNYDCPVLEMNSVTDHIHILFRLSKNYPISKVIENVKKDSSKWIKANTVHNKFAWQVGYGAFSISSSKLDAVQSYFRNQKEHHKRVSFEEEIEDFFKKYKVSEYEKSYFWT